MAARRSKGKPVYDGETYVESLDRPRLDKQQREVTAIMEDHQWHTSREVNAVVAGTDSAITARIRDHRKAKLGYRWVERRRCGDPTRGKHEYKLHPVGATPPPRKIGLPSKKDSADIAQKMTRDYNAAMSRGEDYGPAYLGLIAFLIERGRPKLRATS
jgi:hypothetical protein